LELQGSGAAERSLRELTLQWSSQRQLTLSLHWLKSMRISNREIIFESPGNLCDAEAAAEAAAALLGPISEPP